MESYIKQGDCLELMKEIPDASVDMVLCDLPFGTTRNAWDSIIPLDKLWEQYKRIAKPNAAIVLFAQTPFDKTLGASNLEMLKYEWIWKKESGTGFLNAKKAPLKEHENILVFYKKPPIYNPQMKQGKPYKCKAGKQKNQTYDVAHMVDVVTENKGERYPTTILRFPRDKYKIHPTQKPVDLLRYLIRTYTNSGGGNFRQLHWFWQYCNSGSERRKTLYRLRVERRVLCQGGQQNNAREERNRKLVV